ncbi:hypothetical protein [Qipengyuania soli]|uniref:Peptidase M10 metallopeptidase domain-containing protein n=1 Tax=Qipengyuania soli TaxID=2782568 RepID=A0A7S8ITP4_9SPHN|nr:hypothetical protein [Qipengyuania soli]QPC98074.1 hypothetical protein IRL76_09285 [Qipengyuania soli]
MKPNKLFIAAGTATAAVAAVFAGPSLANHSWSNYHWSTTDGVARPDVVDNTVGSWPARVAIAMGDWNGSAHIQSATSAGTANAKRCPMASGTIQVCNSAYGQTGWLGIASISLSGGHIVAGSTKLNDTYFSYPQYNTETWKQLVTCQEIGHDYGLGHQNEDFSTDLTSSCMEYTSDPSGNEHPDKHDYDQLALIYNHSEGGGSTSSSGGSSGGPGNGGGKGKPLGIEPGDSPAQWGKAVGKDAAGRPNEFVRNFNGYTVITHVTWAPHVKVPAARE